jgi:hypothetical protein
VLKSLHSNEEVLRRFVDESCGMTACTVGDGFGVKECSVRTFYTLSVMLPYGQFFGIITRKSGFWWNCFPFFIRPPCLGFNWRKSAYTFA